MAFAPRRPKARKIPVVADASSDEETKAPKIVRKKPITPVPSAPSTPVATPSSDRPKLKKKSSLRLSFGGGVGPEDEADGESVFTPKKSALSRKAMARNAARKAGSVVGMENLTLTPGQDRVSYSKDYLAELKAEQIAAAAAAVEMEGATVVDEDVNMDDLDQEPEETEEEKLRGAVVVRNDDLLGLGGSGIMDEGLVRIMKERRTERAQAGKHGAKDFISLNDMVSDEESGGELMLRPKKKKESRLQLADDGDDEIGNYADDSGAGLAQGRKAQREMERRRKKGIRDAIAEAEGSDDSDVSRDSQVEEFERDQIRAGAFATGHASQGIEAELENIAQHPPAVGQLPDIKDVVARLEASLKAMEIRQAQTVRAHQALGDERREILEREGMIQSKITLVGVEYEKLKKETGLEGGGEGGVVSRGLESFGGTPIRIEE